MKKRTTSTQPSSFGQIGILILAALFILTSYIRNNEHTEFEGSAGLVKFDSAKSRLQILIDSLYGDIFQYNDLVFQRDELLIKKEELKLQNDNTNDSLLKLNSFRLETICSRLNNKEPENKVKTDLSTLYKSIFLAELEKERIVKNIHEIDSATNKLASEVTDKEKKYKKDTDLLAGAVESLEGAGYLTVKNITYRYFIAQKNIHSVRIHNSKKNGQSVKDIITILNKEHIEPLMITNGGMYTPEYDAQGLLIENFKEEKKLDTAKPKNDKNLNFYLQPNGVFCIDSSGLFNVLPTDEYKKIFSGKVKNPKFATQSGPMLVINRSINVKFKIRSNNLYVRNGVGLINNEKAIFIISDSPVNLYDFSLLFKDIFKCKDALYLDGAISRMYLNGDKSGNKNQNDNIGNFGPAISITKLKKAI